MINIAINGYGRIGRAIHRLALSNSNLNVVAINDINPDINNIAYLLNYDSTYGPLKEKAYVKDDYICTIGSKTKIFNFNDIAEVPWQNEKVEILIDSSGVAKNYISAKALKSKLKNIIFTNSPNTNLVDKTVVFGVNQNEINIDKDFLISSSICDAVAFAPIAKIINDTFEIKKGFLTTLHPWLGYQNLLDGPSKSYAVPGNIIDNYALGRSSPMTLIPKSTSAISATYKVLPNLENKFISMSYRIPTNVVTSADITLNVNKYVDINLLLECFKQFQDNNPKILRISEDALVSTDFEGDTTSVIVDKRFLQTNGNFIKMITWYDNEMGYSARVIDLILFLG